MKKQLRHVVIYFFINISVILNFWPAILSKIKETKKLSGNTSCIADIFSNELGNIWGGRTKNTSKQQQKNRRKKIIA